jgi:hypothetical protein
MSAWPVATGFLGAPESRYRVRGLAKEDQMSKSPLQQVKDRFGSKEALVKEVKGLVEKTDLFVKKLNESKGLEHVSNLKLLRLHRLLSEVQEKYGSREKLVTKLLEIEGRVKDADYRKRFEKYTIGRLHDAVQTAERRVRNAAKKAKNVADRATGKSPKPAQS